MRILSGVDIIEINRIKESIETLGDKFIEKVYTKDEVEYCEKKKNSGKYESYAARFAAKEAVSKALGTGIGKNASFKDITIINDAYGMPKAILVGTTAERAAELGITDISLSISHSKDYAVAVVAALCEKSNIL